jgi:hypothetical protein
VESSASGQPQGAAIPQPDSEVVNHQQPWTPLTKAIERQLDKTIVNYLFAALRLPGIAHEGRGAVSGSHRQTVYQRHHHPGDQDEEVAEGAEQRANGTGIFSSGGDGESKGKEVNLVLFGAAAAAAVAAANASIASVSRPLASSLMPSHLNHQQQQASRAPSSRGLLNKQLSINRQGLGSASGGDRRRHSAADALAYARGPSRQSSGLPLNLLQGSFEDETETEEEVLDPDGHRLGLGGSQQQQQAAAVVAKARPLPKDPMPHYLQIATSPRAFLESIIDTPTDTRRVVDISHGILTPVSEAGGKGKLPISPGAAVLMSTMLIPDPSDPLEMPQIDKADKARKKPVGFAVSGSSSEDAPRPRRLLGRYENQAMPEDLNLAEPAKLPDLNPMSSSSSVAEDGDLSTVVTSDSSKLQLPKINAKKRSVYVTPAHLYDEDGRRIVTLPSTTTASASQPPAQRHDAEILEEQVRERERDQLNTPPATAGKTTRVDKKKSKDKENKKTLKSPLTTATATATTVALKPPNQSNSNEEDPQLAMADASAAANSASSSKGSNNNQQQ